jgi:SAM-dependent methyltransferase
VAADSSKFLADQQRAFLNADDRHFFWQTDGEYFSGTERRLLDGFPFEAGARVLEVGGGEGGNLRNLLDQRGVRPKLIVGLDLFHRKLTFGARHVPEARFVCADATQLPFPDGAFDVVLCRDLLHHLPNREPAVRELRRVCRGGGTVWVIEPNGRNPLIALFALAIAHERGQLQTSVGSLEALVRRHFGKVALITEQPLPVYRALLHYRFGWPALGRSAAFATAMRWWCAAAAALMPRRLWAYIIVRVNPDA